MTLPKVTYDYKAHIPLMHAHREYALASDITFKGVYADIDALRAAIPAGTAGWWAILADVNHIAIWDAETTDWVDTAVSGTVTSVFGRTGVVAAELDDYAASLIANDSNVPSETPGSNTVADALDTLYKMGGTETLPAAVGLSALKAVYMDPVSAEVAYADNTAAATTGRCMGVTTTAEGAGVVKVLTGGLMSDSGWTWTPGAPIYVGSPAGMLTQTLPTKLGGAVYQQEIGIALSATLVKIEIQPAITLV